MTADMTAEEAAVFGFCQAEVRRTIAEHDRPDVCLYRATWLVDGWLRTCGIHKVRGDHAEPLMPGEDPS